MGLLLPPLNHTDAVSTPTFPSRVLGFVCLFGGGGGGKKGGLLLLLGRRGEEFYYDLEEGVFLNLLFWGRSFDPICVQGGVSSLFGGREEFEGEEW